MPEKETPSVWIQKGYFVYIMSSQRRVLYVGLTGSLVRRILQHKTGDLEGFTSRYKVTQLVYYQCFENVHNAIRREKEIKGWIRQKKVAPIEGVNPKWKDLSARWFNSQSDEEFRRMFASINHMDGKDTL